MKKLIALILVGCMAFSISVLAADLDLSSMSTDELIALRKQITEEINARTMDESGRINTGTYIVGTDIRAGLWDVSDPQPEDGGTSVWIATYEDREAEKDGHNMDMHYLHDGETASISLIDGTLLCIGSGSLLLSEANASWMP